MSGRQPLRKRPEQGLWRPYRAAFRIRMAQNLQYRVAALAGMATQFVWGLMRIMILEAFYRGSDASVPMDLSQAAAYIWLQQAFLIFFVLWFRDHELIEQIRSGQVAYELCRPVNLLVFWYLRLLAQRLAAAMLRCLPILIVAFLLPRPWRLTLPPSAGALLLFGATLFLGLLLNVMISLFIYLSTFLTISPQGLIFFMGAFGEFAAGGILPLPLMPLQLQTILQALPFHLTADLPFRVWSGHLAWQEALKGMGLQLFWLVGLGFLAVVSFARIRRRIAILGG